MAVRRCMNCMKEFSVPEGYENQYLSCPHCGFVEGTPPKEPFHLYPGTLLQDRYLVGVVIGCGGFGITYKAWDIEFGVVVAIKEYFPAGLVSREPGQQKLNVYEGSRKNEFYQGLDRFLEEARRTAQFEHSKYIVQVKNFFQENNTAYIVMEYLDGGSLKEFLRNNPVLPVEDAISITDSVLGALKELHKEGILHRDIGPGNIFLSGRSIKIIDFGAARLSDETKEVTRSIVLTPGFAPPEQYQTKSKQGPWTDIYAVAATLYDMVTGKKPCESTDRLMDDMLLDPNRVNPQVPEYLSNAIMKGMAVNPEMRFRTVEEFSDAIHNNTKVLSPKEELKKRKKKRLLLIAAISCIVLAGIGVAAIGFISSYRKSHLRSATVKMWVPYDDEWTDRETAEAHYQSIFQTFSEKNPDVVLEMECIAESEYLGKLESAKQAGTLPDVFLTRVLDSDLLSEAEALENVYNDVELQNTENYYFLDQYRGNAGEAAEKALPTGINVPIVYCRFADTADSEMISKTRSASITDLGQMNSEESLGYFVSAKDYSMLINTFGGSYRYSDKLVLDDTASGLVTEMGKSNFKAEAPPSSGTSDNAAYGKALDGIIAKAVGEGKIDYYVGDMRDLNRIESMAGMYVPRPINADKIVLEFCDYWYINRKVRDDKDVQRAAEELLVYVMMEDAQHAMHMEGYRDAVPIRRAAFENVDTEDSNLSFVKDYMLKAEFLYENQAKEKEYSINLQRGVIIDKKDLREWLEEQ